MTINEPATVLTDFVLGVQLLIQGILLLKRTELRVRKLVAAAFHCLAVASFAGGTFHAIRIGIPDSASSFLWNLTMIFIGITIGLIASALTGARFSGGRPWLWGSVLVTLAGIGVLALTEGFAPSFNQNDVFHCIAMLALWFFYRGVVRLEDRPIPCPSTSA